MNAMGVEHQERSCRVPNSALQREFLALLDAHGGVLMGMLRRLCGNHHEAEDVFQETAARSGAVLLVGRRCAVPELG